MLKKRLLTAGWSLPLVTLAVWFGDPWFSALAIVCGVLGGWEFYGLAGAKAPPLTLFGLMWISLFILSPHFGSFVPLLLTSAMVLSLVFSVVRGRPGDAFFGWALTVAGILYIGWLLSHLVGLRGMDGGRGWVFLALFTTFASDTTAYLVGSAWGRRRLAPAISPRKTWEGALGGGVAAMVVSPLIGALFTLPVGIVPAVLLGLAVSISGQLGDLSLSLLKRSVGVKHAGDVLPGHGGMLDRLNSVLFAGVAVFYFVAWAQWAG